MNDFDRLIKETYENHEYPYDSSVWDNIENELGATTPGMLDFFKSVTTGLALAGAVFVGMLIFSSDTGSGNHTTDKTKLASNQYTEGSEANYSKEELTTVYSGVDSAIIENDFNNLSDSSISNNEENDGNKDETTNFTKEQKSTIEAVLAEAKKMSTEIEDKKVSNKESNPYIDDKTGTSVMRGCTGLTINFDAPQEYGSNAKYLWNFGDGFFSNEENPTHVFNKEGIFDVSLSVTATGSGQISSNVVQAMIEVHEAPEAEFYMEINSINEVKLVEKSMNAVNVEWFIDSQKEIAEDSDILLSVADNTKYDVELVAQNAGNCSDSLRKELHFIKAGNQFPQVYSSAYASDFAPGAIVDNGEVTDFRVFEKRSGTEVFKSSGSKGWNGKNKDGTNVAKGEYQWLMVVDSETGYNVYHGHLNIR